MLKKKMKNKFNLILGIMFLLTLLPIISAYDWVTYCNDFTPCWNGQYSSAYGELTAGNIETRTSIDGYYTQFGSDDTLNGVGERDPNFAWQPLVMPINRTSTYAEYLVFPNGNTLTIKNKNLVSLYEINTGGHAVANIDSLQWDDEDDREIAGLWEANATTISFKVYKYNQTTDTFNKIYEQNFTTTTRNGFSGIRHQGGDAYFVMPDSVLNKMNFTQINSSGIFNQGTINKGAGEYNEHLGWQDMDNDDIVEYLIHNRDEVLIFHEDGTIVQTINRKSPSHQIIDAKIVKTDEGNIWRIAVMQGVNGNSPPIYTDGYVTIYRLDGSTYWENSYYQEGGEYGKMAVGTYYNYPNWFERWILGQEEGLETMLYVAFYGGYASGTIRDEMHFLVLEAVDGNAITDDFYDGIPFGAGYGDAQSLTIADVNHNGIADFIYSANRGNVLVYDPETQEFIINQTISYSGYGLRSCIPADLTFNGQQEIICSGQGGTTMFYSDIANNNAVINSVSYNPSTSIEVNTTLTMIIYANDSEGDSPLYYRHRCFETDNWSAETTSPVKTCEYASVGVYQTMVAVRDPFHTAYVTYPQNIIVTTTGLICDNDLICEASAGETYLNCPNDCPAPAEEEIPDTTTAEGGISIPTQLVDTENINQGLLPEIYYGTLGFMSNILRPTIIVVFVIFFALIMITIGMIVKKIGQKVGSISR